MWEHICPKCRKLVKGNSHVCPHCGEHYPQALKIPPTFLKDKKRLEEYVHKHVFPRISKFERDYLTQYFTILFSDNFASGSFSAWTTTATGDTGDVIEVSSAETYQSTYSCYISQVTGWSGDTYAEYDFSSSYPTVYLRAYVYITSFPASGSAVNYLWTRGSSGSISKAGVYYDGTYYYWFVTNFINSQAQTNYQASISLNVWYCVEMETVISASAGIIQLWINGTSVINLTGQNTGSNNITIIRISESASNGNAGGTPSVYIDDVVAADAYNGPLSAIPVTYACHWLW